MKLKLCKSFRVLKSKTLKNNDNGGNRIKSSKMSDEEKEEKRALEILKNMMKLKN